MLQYSGWGEKEMGFGSVSHSWEARGFLTCSHLTRQRSRWLRRALSALSELCCLGGMCEVGEIRLFLPCPVHLISHFIRSSGRLELLHRTPGLSQRLSSLWLIV